MEKFLKLSRTILGLSLSFLAQVVTDIWLSITEKLENIKQKAANEIREDIKWLDSKGLENNYAMLLSFHKSVCIVFIGRAKQEKN